MVLILQIMKNYQLMLAFRFRILDNNDIIYSQDKNITIKDHGDLSIDVDI